MPGPTADGVHLALEHPNASAACGFAAGVLLLPVTRRAVWASTLGRLRGDAAAVASAQRRAALLRSTLEDQAKEISKLTERADLAEQEYARGRVKLLAAGGQLRKVASQAASLQNKLAGSLVDVESLRLRHPVAETTAEAHAAVVATTKDALSAAQQQRARVDKHLRRVANLVPV